VLEHLLSAYTPLQPLQKLFFTLLVFLSELPAAHPHALDSAQPLWSLSFITPLFSFTFSPLFFFEENTLSLCYLPWSNSFFNSFSLHFFPSTSPAQGVFPFAVHLSCCPSFLFPVFSISVSRSLM